MTSAIHAEDLVADVAALPLRRLLVALKRCHVAGMDVTDITPGASVVHGVATPPALCS
jgi:hypothetical protein